KRLTQIDPRALQYVAAQCRDIARDEQNVENVGKPAFRREHDWRDALAIALARVSAQRKQSDYHRFLAFRGRLVQGGLTLFVLVVGIGTVLDDLLHAADLALLGGLHELGQTALISVGGTGWLVGRRRGDRLR